MRNIRIGLCLLIFFGSSHYAAAQKEKNDFSALINTDLSVFKNEVISNTGLFTEKEWNKLYSKAQENIFDGDYQKASDYAAKSQILAEAIGNHLLNAQSYRLSGEINLNKEKIPEAISDFHLSQDCLFNADKAPKDLVAAEYGRLILDVVETQATDRLFNSQDELDKAFLNVGTVIKFCDQHPDNEVFNDIKTSALIKQAGILEMEEHYSAEIILLEQIDAAHLFSRHQVLDLYKLNIGLLRAFRAIGNYEKSYEHLRTIEKLFPELPFAEKSLYLRELAEFYSDTNNLAERDKVLDKARRLAETSGNKYRLGIAISAQMLVLMKDQRFSEAEKYFFALRDLSKDSESLVNQLDLAVAAAVFASVKGDSTESAEKFLEADRILADFKRDPGNARFLFYWKSFAAANEKRFNDLRSISLDYLKLAEDSGKVDSLPAIYFNLARSSYELKDFEAAQTYNEHLLALIDQKRNSKYAGISIGVAELLHRAFELQTSLNLLAKNTVSAFQIAEKSKGQFLADKLSGSKKQSVEIRESARAEILETAKLKTKNPGDKNIEARLSAIEKSAVESVSQTPKGGASEDILSELQSSAITDETQVLSYAFNADDRLAVFSWTRASGLKVTILDIKRSQIDRTAFETSQKIKNNIFFKKTGKELYELFLKPLNISTQTKHLIIIPDGSLWKIPFQALSATGEKYLIEEKQISYAPSVPILLGALKSVKTETRKATAFANSDYQNTRLAFADREAAFVAAEYSTKPILGARIEDFKNLASDSDILHFSMHAEVDRANPLDSFLAFRDGKLTVEELLDLKIKKGSLVFLASCNTDNIYNSEGLVSLAWGMSAAGAATVISSQWETDDEASGMFTKTFYTNYRMGLSRSEALRQAAISMINDKSGKNKPYFWAEFFLMGDYR